jgi:methionyl-tRNA formyltransferase
MRVIFMGTPDFAVPALNALIAAGHEIICVYTQPPRRAGRGKALSPTAVQQRAAALGLNVRCPVTLRDAQAQAEFAALNADVAIVAAYGLILPLAILDAPVHGCLNIHGSLLPRWRGAAPVQRAILAGDPVTGITIMQMDAGLDTGPMLARAETAATGKTAGELTDELAALGAALLVRVLNDRAAFPPMAQPDSGVTYATKIDKGEARLDFMASAAQTERQIRAFAPTPGAFFEQGGERIRILAAQPLIAVAARPGTVIDTQLTIACNPGAIRPTLVQRAGRNAMTPAALLRGFPIAPGTIV